MHIQTEVVQSSLLVLSPSKKNIKANRTENLSEEWYMFYIIFKAQTFCKQGNPRPSLPK